MPGGQDLESDLDVEEFEQDVTTHYSAYGIMGILSVATSLFLVIITDRQPVAKFPCGNMVYEITEIDFVPLSPNLLQTQMATDTINYLDGIKNIIEGTSNQSSNQKKNKAGGQGYYFSYYVDLTSNQ